jgi:S1-C subfamily serine protease
VNERVIEAIEKVSPSVVTINTTTMAQDIFFRTTPVQGMGSGVIIDEKGYILTNAHIVGDADKLEVVLSDGRAVSGSVVGTDESSDIAVVRISASDLKAASLGDSDKLRVGQVAIAIGNPFGFMLGGPTVTVGVVSALKRHIQAEDVIYEDLVQTDAAINPGNSGGPLVDEEGRVIAINTAMIPYAQGIGFAIPINPARDLARELMEHGRIVRPWLGIVGADVNQQMAARYSLPMSEGAVVLQVSRGSPAEAAGIRPGDIIIQFGDSSVTSMGELKSAVSKRKVGEIVEIKLVRGSKLRTVKIVLEAGTYSREPNRKPFRKGF